MPDVAEWRFDGSKIRQKVQDLAREFRLHNEQSSPMPMRRLVELLPVETPDLAKILAMGSLDFSSGCVHITGRGADIQLKDPGLGTFFVAAPDGLAANVSADQVKLALQLRSKLRVEIPALEHAGLNRSKYQQVASISISSAQVITYLIDEVHSNRQTSIIVELAPDNLTSHQLSVLQLTFVALGSPCDGGGGGGNGGGAGTDRCKGLWKRQDRGDNQRADFFIVSDANQFMKLVVERRWTYKGKRYNEPVPFRLYPKEEKAVFTFPRNQDPDLAVLDCELEGVGSPTANRCGADIDLIDNGDASTANFVLINRGSRSAYVTVRRTWIYEQQPRSETDYRMLSSGERVEIMNMRRQQNPDCKVVYCNTR